MRDLAQGEGVARVQASRLLSTDPATSPELLGLLDGESRADVRHAILYALSWHDNLGIWKRMVGILSDRSEASKVRGQAAEYLSYLFHRVSFASDDFKSAVDALLESLTDPSPEVRYCAVNALGSTGYPPLLPALERMCSDQTPVPGWVGTVSDEASQAIETLESISASRKCESKQ
ncbi:HEAT repeat domain-containing protein [Myxococcaceae bacterium JPH2]|nr:HEAT repeat domain-containing protein [Myxococcaceae bacterium JPH2]